MFCLVKSDVGDALRSIHIKHLKTLKRNKSHGLGAMHLKEIIKTTHMQLKSRMSHQWFTQNVF